MYKLLLNIILSNKHNIVVRVQLIIVTETNCLFFSLILLRNV
jgi:hypothetical protein